MSREVPAAVWDPAQYGAFGDERGRPFFELLARVPAAAPARVVDLGCGSGELTAALARRWPEAAVEGIDSSPDMIEAARRHEIAGRLSFAVGDLAGWRPGGPVGVIVSNAALQWVPGHLDLLPRWLDALAPGGALAFQVPGNFDAPSHVLLRELLGSPRWRDRLGGAAAAGGLARRHPVSDPTGYLDVLARHGARVDAWETTYTQVLRGPDPVLEWMKGTALRPVLTVLENTVLENAVPENTAALDDSGDDGGHDGPGEFLAELGALLRDAYPAGPYGTVFPFRRIFVVARRPA